MKVMSAALLFCALGVNSASSAEGFVRVSGVNLVDEKERSFLSAAPIWATG